MGSNENHLGIVHAQGVGLLVRDEVANVLDDLVAGEKGEIALRFLSGRRLSGSKRDSKDVLHLLDRMTLSVESMFQVEYRSAGSFRCVDHQSRAHEMRRDLPGSSDDHVDGSSVVKVLHVEKVPQPPD